MTRIAATIHGDARLQLRQGFYWAAAFVLGVLIAVGRELPADILAWLLPVLILSNVQINTFYFFAGLVLLEKAEGTLEAQVVTPLRPWEYLASKVATLTALSVVENVVLVLLTRGAAGVTPGLVAGIVLLSVFFCLAGFLAVARYDSINEYLMPSFVYTAVLSLPILPYFDLAASPLFDLHPVQAPLLLFRGAFEAAEGPSITARLASVGWTAAAAVVCRRAFDRFVVRREGGPASRGRR